MPADKISIESAKGDKLFYFVANVLVCKDGKCLLLKRSETEKVHPGRWATPGGKMEWKDFDLNNPTRMNGEVFDYLNSIEDLLKRETKEEAGIEIGEDFRYINSNTFIRPDGIPVVLVKFAAEYKSGDIKLEEGAFTDFVWVDSNEVKNYECIDGIPFEVERALELFNFK